MSELRRRLAAWALCVVAASLGGAAGRASAATPDVGIDRVVNLPDGRRIALRCVGRGPFTVLLEPGDGGRRTHMAALSAALSDRYRVCDYDRRNVGRRSSAPLPRTAAGLTADLFDALSAAGVEGPYILFGSSMGGLLVRAHAATHPVAGFVTSNQTATTGEWTAAAHPLMTPAERAADTAWAAGDNNEHIDVDDVSRAIEAAGPPRAPHIIMISTERFQCPAAGTCGPTYQAFVEVSRRLARSGSRGELRLLDGDHDLYVTHLAQVVRAIDDIAALGREGR